MEKRNQSNVGYEKIMNKRTKQKMISCLAARLRIFVVADKMRRGETLLGIRDAYRSSKSCTKEKTLVGCLATGLRIVVTDEMLRGVTPGCFVVRMQIGIRRVVQLGC